MGDVVNIKPIRLEENQDFVRDCCRFQEGLLTEARMKMKYGFADGVWEKLGDDMTLLEAVEDEKLRRIRDGSSKREKSQALVVKAPDVLGKIMDDDNQSARHRIDSCKVLNDLASNGPGQSAPAADRFIISINLSGDGVDHVLHFDKSIAITAGDTDPSDDRDDDDTNIATPWGLIATAKKQDDGGNDNTI